MIVYNKVSLLTHWILLSVDFFMKPFKTNHTDTVRNCQKEFEFELPSVILARRSEHFLINYTACDNAFCKCV